MQLSIHNWKQSVAAVAVAGTLMLGGGLVAHAQSSDTTTTNPREVVQTAIADALGMTVEELEDQLWAGRTLADLAEEAGVDVADLRAAAETAQQDLRIEQIQAAVEAGEISQEQADWMIEGIEKGYMPAGRGGFGMDRRGPGGFDGQSFGQGMERGEGRGMPGMRNGRGMGQPFDGPNAPDAPQAPDSGSSSGSSWQQPVQPSTTDSVL